MIHKIVAVAFTIISLLYSNQTFPQWVQMSNGMGTNRAIICLAVSGNNIFAGTDSGAFRSTNNGANWTGINNGLPDSHVISFAINGNNMFAGTYEGVYHSTNNGESWTAKGLMNQNVNSLATNGTLIFAGTVGGSGSAVFISANNGDTWSQSSLTNVMIVSFAISGVSIFAESWIGGAFHSSTYGTSWNAVNGGLPIQFGMCNAANSSFIFTGTAPEGIFRSSNNGGNWTSANIGLRNRNVYSLAVSRNYVFSGSDTAVSISTNNGASWIEKNQGFNSFPHVGSLLITNNYIFAGTYQSVWRRSLSEIIGIQNINTEIPRNYKLEQNYPNPFNPTTVISFQLPVDGLVSLKVFDLLGREAATLVNEKLAPGTYTVDWNASQFPSGVYFYRLTAGNSEGSGQVFTETKRMTIIK